MTNIDWLRRGLFGIGIVLMVALGFQAYESVRHRGLVGVEILVLPKDSKLTIDSIKTRPGKIYLSKGNHTLVASLKDFDNDTKTISTNDIDKNETIYMLPAANSAAAKQWLLQHPDVQQQREAAGGAEAERVRNLLISKYPIISKLPYENLDFKIDYTLDLKNSLSFTITLYAILNRPSQYDQYKQQVQQYKGEALEYLRQNGIDTKKFNINYIPNL